MLKHVSLRIVILVALCQVAAAFQTADGDRIGFTVPAAPFTLTLPKSDLVITNQQVKPDGQSGYFRMTDRRGQLNISFFMEPATKCHDSRSCRDMVWKSGNPSWENPQNVVMTELGGISCFEFLIPSLRGVPVQQYNVYAQFVKDGFWIDLHLSKVGYKPDERELFDRVIKSVRLESTSLLARPKASAKSKELSQVMQYLREGSERYLNQDFKAAIVLYARALDLEKNESTLDQTAWRVLVDNLGMAYGMTGDLKGARETLEYGVSKDSKYPLFHYNLACTHAEMGDLDRTITYLKRSFELRNNLNAGEKMPDPRQDDSFKRFIRDSRFLTALAEVEKSN